jgi:hypothetical protein
LVDRFEITTVFSGSKKLNLTNLRVNIFYINRTMGYIQDKSYLKDRIHHEDSTNLKSFNDISNRTGYKIKLETDSVEYRFINPLVLKDQERSTIIREIIGNVYPHETPITSTFDEKRYDPGVRRDEEERIESYGERNELLAERRDENLPGVQREVVERVRYPEQPERFGDIGVVETRERKTSSPPHYGGQPSPRDYDSYRDYDKYREHEREKVHPTERRVTTTTDDQKIGRSEMMEKPYDTSYARGYTRDSSGLPERIDAQRDTRDKDLVGQQNTRERRESGGYGEKRFEQPLMAGRDTRDREYDEQRERDQHPTEFRREGQQLPVVGGGAQRRDSSSTIPVWQDEHLYGQQQYHEYPYRDQQPAVGTTQRRDSGAIARDTDRQPSSSAQAAQHYQGAGVAREPLWQSKGRGQQHYQDSGMIAKDTRDVDWQTRDREQQQLQQYRNLDSTRDTNMQQQTTSGSPTSSVQAAKQYLQEPNWQSKERESQQQQQHILDSGVSTKEGGDWQNKDRGSQYILDSGVSTREGGDWQNKNRGSQQLDSTITRDTDRPQINSSVARDNGWQTKERGSQHFQDVGVAREPNWQNKDRGSQHILDSGVSKDNEWQNTGSQPGSSNIDDSHRNSRFTMSNFPSAT